MSFLSPLSSTKTAGNSNSVERSSTIVRNSSQNHIAENYDDNQLLHVKWDKFDPNLISMFKKYREQGHFLDCLLSCEGKTIKCHKLVLSACSDYFEDLLISYPNPHPIVFLRYMKYWELTTLVDFMYNGEIIIHKDELDAILKAAESLQMKSFVTINGKKRVDQGSKKDVKLFSEPIDLSTKSSGIQSLQSGRNLHPSLLQTNKDTVNLQCPLISDHQGSAPGGKSKKRKMASGLNNLSPATAAVNVSSIPTFWNQPDAFARSILKGVGPGVAYSSVFVHKPCTMDGNKLG